MTVRSRSESGVAAQPHQLQRRQDRRQRVAQLVAQHRQELVLGAVRPLSAASRSSFTWLRACTCSVTSDAMTKIPWIAPSMSRNGE